MDNETVKIEALIHHVKVTSIIMEINMHKLLRKLKCPSAFYESEEDVYQFAMHSQEIVGWKQWIWLVNLHVQTNSKPSESTKA